LMVQQPTQRLVCSGALIAPNIVATARHCVADPFAGPIRCGHSPIGAAYPPRAIDVSTTLSSDNSLPSEAGAHHAVVDVRVVPDGNDTCGFDVALLVLADVVSTGEAKPLVPRFAPPLRDGDGYAAIGYGATCGDLVNQERCRIESGGRRRVDGL